MHPAVAVVSTGVRNRFGHPHPKTLAALAAAAIPVLRTDQRGAVAIETDGARLEVRSASGPAAFPIPSRVEALYTGIP